MDNQSLESLGIHFYSMSMAVCLYVYMYIACMHAWCRELVVGCTIGADNQTWAL